MPESISVGWRRKIHSRPKESPLLRPSDDEAPVAETWSEVRRHQAWRKALHGSRPGTPNSVASALTASATDEVEDASSERSETSSPRRNSRPKLTRYTSFFSSFIDLPKGPEFAEPWGEDPPTTCYPYVDLLSALQSIRSHIMTSVSKPIPTQHNNGLLRIFEDYLKLREVNDCLELRLQKFGKDWKEAEDQWAQSERYYTAEIRRLKLLIDHSSKHMSRHRKTKHGSINGQNHNHRRNASTSRVAMHRSTSPSRQMTVLSKQFVDIDKEKTTDLLSEKSWNKTTTLKAQSELDLTQLKQMNLSQSISNSVNSVLSESNKDFLIDDIKCCPVSMAPIDDWDALVTLRELSTQVAKQRGLKVDKFTEDLMALLSSSVQGGALSADPTIPEPLLLSPTEKLFLLENKPSQRIQSQGESNSDQKRRRHFSFEPGDDDLHTLGQMLKPSQPVQQTGGCIDSDVARLRFAPTRLLDIQPGSPPLASTALKVKNPRPTKIPSPAHKKGEFGRENSGSSSHSTVIFDRSRNTRRDSRSSVQTAFRADSKGGIRPAPKYKNRPCPNVRAKDYSLALVDEPGDIQNYNASAVAETVQDAERSPLYMRNNPSVSNVGLSENEPSSCTAGSVEKEH